MEEEEKLNPINDALSESMLLEEHEEQALCYLCGMVSLCLVSLWIV